MTQTIIVNDSLMWCAVLHDGTLIPEYDEERPDGRGFAEVDASQIAALELFNVPTTRYHRVDIPEGASPVLFRRRKVEFNIETGEQNPQETIHCIGWTHNEQGVYLFLFEDGRTLLTSDLQAV